MDPCPKVPARAPWDRWRLAGISRQWAEGPALEGASGELGFEAAGPIASRRG